MESPYPSFERRGPAHNRIKDERTRRMKCQSSGYQETTTNGKHHEADVSEGFCRSRSQRWTAIISLAWALSLPSPLAISPISSHLLRSWSLYDCTWPRLPPFWRLPLVACASYYSLTKRGPSRPTLVQCTYSITSTGAYSQLLEGGLASQAFRMLECE